MRLYNHYFEAGQKTFTFTFIELNKAEVYSAVWSSIHTNTYNDVKIYPENRPKPKKMLQIKKKIRVGGPIGGIPCLPELRCPG